MHVHTKECVHSLDVAYFFLGRLMGAVIGSAIFWWTSPVFFFVIQLGMASIAITIGEIYCGALHDTLQDYLAGDQGNYKAIVQQEK